ncbi:MAG TPA: cupin domain-containing protein [Gaiellaceae bacterium]|jgi:quercetin dioxygenase-like cupin family protein|nr:cupin domain-containing protein [Gaiellaceae bacterium]
MASEAEAQGDGEETNAAVEPETAEGESPAEGVPADAAGGEGEEEGPHWVEVWNEYDPSMRFVVIFPVGEKQGATAGSAAYYIVEPGKHTGLHSDNVEEIAFVAEGEGEVFSIGTTQPLEAGKFVVFQPGMDHDIYARGADALRILSFFPTTEILTTFQQEIYPVGGNILSSAPPQTKPRVIELDPENLPEDFPFSLEELGLTEVDPAAPRELTMTEKLIGMTEPGVPPPPFGPESVIDPHAPPKEPGEEPAAEEPKDEE